MKLILASTSTYRRELLSRLRIAFDSVPPGVDETPVPGESPAEAASRLGLAKARAVAALHPEALVIGSDQTASVDGREIIGKPGSHERARIQLRAASGQAMVFHTAMSVVRERDGFCFSRVVDTRVRFRKLSDDEIEAYLLAEKPYDCAGSARSEALGISLLESIDCNDPTALVGLPLIALCDALREAGFPLLADTRQA
jgi:septum formation protein